MSRLKSWRRRYLPGQNTPTPRTNTERQAVLDTATEILDQGYRADRRIPSILLRTPISRIGYLWACGVGLVWGGLWSTGKVERHGKLWVFRGMPKYTYARGGSLVGRCFLTGDRQPSATVLRHEEVHRLQWLKFGFLLPLLYAFSGRDPFLNRFEIEAGLVDGGYLWPDPAATTV